MPATWWTSDASWARTLRTSCAAARIASARASRAMREGNSVCRAASTITTESKAHFENRFGIAIALPMRICPSSAKSDGNRVPFSAALQNGQRRAVFSSRSRSRSTSALPRKAFAFSPSAPLIDATDEVSGSVRCSISCSTVLPDGSTRRVLSTTDASSIKLPPRERRRPRGPSSDPRASSFYSGADRSAPPKAERGRIGLRLEREAEAQVRPGQDAEGVRVRVLEREALAKQRLDADAEHEPAF